MRAYSLEARSAFHGAGEARDQSQAATAEEVFIAFASLAAGACSVAHPDRGRRMVVLLECEPASQALPRGRPPRPRGFPSWCCRSLISPAIRRRDYLADALTDELITGVTRVKAQLRWIARNTAFTYNGKPVDAKAIGKDLGVRYVLEGSVQPTGDRMRVNAQLIDAESGAHLWADQFDTPRADLLQMQDEIVTRLANAMHSPTPRGGGRASQTDASGKSQCRGIWRSNARASC